MAVRKRTTRVRHYVVPTSAPVGGLNVRDAIDNMPRGDAIELINWIPQQFGVRCRKGYREWCTGMTNPVRTVMQYQPNRENVASYKLFAATDAAIFDVTTSSASPSSAISLGSTPGIGRMYSVSFANTAGSFLLACSEVGGYWTYDGTSWVKRTSGSGPGHIGGVNPDNLVFVTSWKRRLWFVEKNSTFAWYSETDAITGTLTRFDLGPFAKHGGRLAFIANWTIDAGEGIDDLIVFGFENGDILIYKGTDPSSSSTFAIVGTYFVGALVLGRRGFTTFGGDLVILSELGLQPVSYVTRGGQSLLRASGTDYLGKIQPRFAELVPQFPSSLDWDLTLIPKENLLMVSIPSNQSTVFTQYALYTNTNAWTTLSDIPIRSSVVANNQFYFGTDDGRVCLGFDGYFDNVPRAGGAGNGVLGIIQPAYSYFGQPGMQKQFHMLRPVFLAFDQPSVTAQVLADYRPRPFSGTPIYGTPTSARWDVAEWDEAVWGGGLTPFQNWVSAEALGYVASAYLTTICLGDTFLTSIDYMYEPGGAL